VGVVQLPCLSQRAADRGVQCFGQPSPSAPRLTLSEAITGTCSL
jgi:hypothetical protein